ncbi:hypothetical protein KC360_g98 [Hortaea werneckii]|nr:hypothetical protein KC360_g98 [Hortaea werneckii]
MRNHAANECTGGKTTNTVKHRVVFLFLLLLAFGVLAHAVCLLTTVGRCGRSLAQRSSNAASSDPTENASPEAAVADLVDLKVAAVLRRVGRDHTGPGVLRESTDRTAAVEARRKAAGVHRNHSPVAVAVAADPGRTTWLLVLPAVSVGCLQGRVKVVQERRAAARVTAKPCTCLHGRRLIVLTARAFSSILDARQEVYTRCLAYEQSTDERVGVHFQNSRTPACVAEATRKRRRAYRNGHIPTLSTSISSTFSSLALSLTQSLTYRPIVPRAFKLTQILSRPLLSTERAQCVSREDVPALHTKLKAKHSLIASSSHRLGKSESWTNSLTRA